MPRFAKLVNGIELAEIVRSWRPETVVIERVHAMPKQGVSTTFAFGTSYGIAIGIACGAGAALNYVTPQHWKKHFRLPANNKDASRERAIQLFPDAAKYLTLKKHHGRADALLMARHFLDLTPAYISLHT
jgi:crossover junction endodeoxyribonuclease RuvC